MSPKTLIEANPSTKTGAITHAGFLEVSEFFCDTIQGEGVNMGSPAAFLRLQHCTLNCAWCDTQEVWKEGNPYSFDELFRLMEDSAFALIGKLWSGQHLVITGGSPLKQQMQLINFIEEFIRRYDFKPYIEIENECTIMPAPALIKLVDCWNNSPKLANSGNSNHARFKPKVLATLSMLMNSWFKFVITNEDDWDEIETDFLKTLLMVRQQIILMPQGETRAELEANREGVLQIAIANNVRYSTREHVVIWDKKTGV